VPLRGQRGKILKWYGISLDIEDRKRASEEEREKLRADLAHMNRVQHVGGDGGLSGTRNQAANRCRDHQRQQLH